MITGRLFIRSKMHVLHAAIICMALSVCAPAVKAAIVTEGLVKCVYDPASGIPKPLGQREFITISQIDGDTHFQFQRLPDLMGMAANEATIGATIEVSRKIIFYDTRIQQARKIMRTNNNFYKQLIGYTDPLGYSSYDDTLGCEFESISEGRLFANDTGKKMYRDGLVSAETVLDVEAYGPNGRASATLGDPLTLRVSTAVDAYVSCYYQLSTGDIYKLYPNQFSADYQIAHGDTLTMPGADRYQLVADQSNQFMCLMSGEDILPLLPPVYRVNRFQRIPVTSFDSLYQLYRDATEQNLVARVVTVEVQ